MDETESAPQAVSGRTPAGPRLATLRDFLRTEAGGAIVLLAATLTALVWADSPWRDGYVQLWATDITLVAGDFRLSHDLGHWVNDGLMTLFFLLVGLELRREFDMGEFRERRRVQVPIIAALGGMLLPVAIFVAITPAGEAGGRGSRGSRRRATSGACMIGSSSGRTI